MISGTVNSRREPIIRVSLRGPQGRAREAEVLVDTGFSGALLLPLDFIAELRLPSVGTLHTVLGDGSTTRLKFYKGTILWEGQLRLISVGATTAVPLLGMDLLYGSKLTIEVVEGGEVVIRALSLS